MCSIRTPSPSTTTVAAGSPATNEYLPHRSERSTDSRIRPGPSPASGGEQPDRRGDVGQQLRPHGDQRPLGRERVELVTTGPHLQMRFHVRSS